MQRKPLNKWAVCALTLASVGASGAMRALYFRAFGSQAPFLPFFPAIIVVSLFGGRMAGLVATFLSALLAALWIEPFNSLAIYVPADIVAMALFIVIGVIVVWLCDRTVRGKRLAEIVSLEQAKLAAIVSSSDDAIVSKDLNTIVLSWNKGAEKLFGYASEEMVGQSILRLIPPDRASEEDMILSQLRKGESVLPYQTLRRHKNGTLLPVSVSVSPLRDSEGHVVGASKIARDMSRQRAVEAALQSAKSVAEASLAQLRAVIENMSDGLILSDGKGNLLEWNAAALKLHNFTNLNEVTRPLIAFEKQFKLFTPEGAELPLANWPMSRVLRGETLGNVECIVRRIDAPQEWIVSYSGKPVLDASGNIALALLTLHDVSEQRRSQRAIQETAESLSLALAVANLGDWNWDAKTDDIVLSERALQIFGLKSGARLTRSSIRQMLEPEDRDKAAEANRRAIAERGDYDIEYRANRPDGRQVWVAAKGRGQYDAFGKITRMLGALQDITDRKTAETERERLLESERSARSDAEHASRMKDEFLATLSHELRTPLNAILGWTQILRMDPADSSDRAQGLEIIERNARAQTQIIEDLLDMSRIISGKVRLDVQRMDLASVVESAVGTSRPAAEAKGIRLHAVLDPKAGPVSGDPNRLQQVFWNLLSNAIKFTPRGGRVQVMLERVNSQVEVTVVDSGEGIKVDFLPFVFDRFRQADSTSTRRHGGLGIGLSIVKQLVELHGGSVRCNSSGPGSGASFVVSLPLTVLHTGTDGIGSTERRHPTADTDLTQLEACGQLHGVRVLVVDDDEEARNLFKRLLEGCDAIVKTAKSAGEGLALLKTDPHQVLLSDIGMPGEDGYSFISRVRKLPPAEGGDVPALALTAYARAEDRLKALRAGFQMHLTKPVEPAELIAVVAVLAGRASDRGHSTI